MKFDLSGLWFQKMYWAGIMVLGLLAAVTPAAATHIVGGEMELVHQTGENYTLILNLYFDAVNGNAGALDADLTAGIFEKGSNARKQDVLLPLTSNTFVNYTNQACAVGSLSTRRLVYSRSIVLPAADYTNQAGYYVAVERCCRNNSIANIVSPSSAAQTFYLEFPAVVRNGQPFFDSTPRIFPPLADYACRNELFYYDFSGVDADGDSLVYDLVTPLNGYASSIDPKPAQARSAPYSTITWLNGLNTNNQIPGNPTLRVDRFTGRLTVKPTNIGLFVFGVRCSEYRRGVKIGEVRRDFQMLTLNCARNNTPSLVVQPNAASSSAYLPGRDTLHLVPGGNHCIKVRFTDPDPSSQLTVSLRPVNFSSNLPTFTTATTGAVRGLNMPDTLTATVCFPTCLNSRGRVLLLDLIVADNGCALPRRDTVRVAFTASAPPNFNPRLTSTAGPVLPLHVRVGDVVTFDLTATDPENDPLTLTMTGQGFSPAELGATLTQSIVGNQLNGRFSWAVTCTGLEPPLHNFVFAAAATPCNEQQAASLTVPIIVDYANTAPILTTTFPDTPASGEPPLVRIPLGGVYEATLLGTDANGDALTLRAIGQEFDLTRAGMRFNAQNGPGRATGAFRWDAACDAVNLHQKLFVDFELVDATCQPLPQRKTVRFEVISPDTLVVKQYNIITPNGDHLNDEFKLPELPPNFCDAHFATVSIYSRWGQKVFSATDREFRWPGMGSAGIYYYLVSYSDGRKFKGWLEVKP